MSVNKLFNPKDGTWHGLINIGDKFVINLAHVVFISHKRNKTLIHLTTSPKALVYKDETYVANTIPGAYLAICHFLTMLNSKTFARYQSSIPSLLKDPPPLTKEEKLEQELMDMDLESLNSFDTTEF